jgi:two-component sensor histidine kinase
MSLELVRSSLSPPIDLLAEASHRTSNHFAMLAGLLRLQARGLRKTGKVWTADEAWLVLEECGRRLEIVGKVHQLLGGSPSGAPIYAPDFLRTVVNGIGSSIKANESTRIVCDFSTAWFLSAEEAVALGLLVGELVTNAVKYAHPTGVAGVIRIEATAHGSDEVLVGVSDDGVGLPEGLNPLESCSLGFRMIRSLATQLGAKMSFQDDGLGLSCALQMPAHRRH